MKLGRLGPSCSSTRPTKGDLGPNLPTSLPSGLGSGGLWDMARPGQCPANLCLCFAALTSDIMHQSLFMSALSTHPDRSLSVCWEQHCKLLPGVAGISASAVAKWTIDEV